MSANKRGGGADDIYTDHLFGSRFMNNNPAMNQESWIIRNLERDITEMAMDRFEWKGLEPGMSERFIEQRLIFDGLCVVYMDNDYDKLLAVRASGSGYVNMLDDPITFNVIGPGTVYKLSDVDSANFRPKQLGAYIPAAHSEMDAAFKKKRAVPIWCNNMRYPEFDRIRLYARRIAAIDRTLEVNVKQGRTPKLVRTTPNAKLSALNVASQADSGAEVITVEADFDELVSVDVLDAGFDAMSFKEIAVHRSRVWNEMVTLFGINSANQEKKERLVEAEVGANDDQVASMRYAALNARQYAAGLINDVFGTNISVDFRIRNEEQEEQEREAELDQPKEGEGEENESDTDEQKEAS